jgi:UDP-glucose 4-epimerase
MKVLVAGGAGYIGSHCVRQLQAAGHSPIVVDNLVFGHRQAVAADIPFYQLDLGDHGAMVRLLEKESIDLVMHFAAFAYVGESVTNPRKYYENNSVATLRLLEAMLDTGVKKFVFSSTCATYGEPEKLPITENLAQSPINPYGQTKLDVENLLKSFAHAYGMSFAAFRYFNAAGAVADGSIGEDHNPETHLIPLVIDAAVGKRANIQIFGTDYATPDGTCLRDYVHVDDLSRAHIAAFPLLEQAGQQRFYNLGTGTPNSVREIITAVESISGLKVPVVEAARRPGDPPALYADSSKAMRELGWKLEYPEVAATIETAWRWHRDHPNGFSGKENVL